MQTRQTFDNMEEMTHPQPLFVVVSGPPGSGKTTLATGIAQEMGLPLIAKDLIKETLMSLLAVPDVDTSKMIGRAAVEVHVHSGGSGFRWGRPQVELPSLRLPF